MGGFISTDHYSSDANNCSGGYADSCTDSYADSCADNRIDIYGGASVNVKIGDKYKYNSNVAKYNSNIANTDQYVDYDDVYVIAIYGGTNSGKTTLTQIIEDEFEDQIMRIAQDSFYFTGNESTNFDHPKSIDMQRLIDCVYRAKTKNGEDIETPVYDFVTHSRLATTRKLKRKPIIVVEGILIMTCPELAALCDLKIYVHAELDTMYRRRSKRDKEERGRSQEHIDTQWDRDVKTMHLKYVLPSQQEADITINNDRQQIMTEPHKIPQINIVLAYIAAYLKERME